MKRIDKDLLCYYSISTGVVIVFDILCCVIYWVMSKEWQILAFGLIVTCLIVLIDLVLMFVEKRD